MRIEWFLYLAELVDSLTALMILSLIFIAMGLLFYSKVIIDMSDNRQ